jgi:indole-3-acetate monooxygenase
MRDVWAALTRGAQAGAAQQARLASVVNHVMGICVEVVQLVCKVAGGSAVYRKGPFDRCLRDVLTMNQHVLASPRAYEAAGRLLMGLPPLRPIL